MLQYHRSVATAAIMAGACRETLSEASEAKVAACGDKLKAGYTNRTSFDPAATVAAQSCLDTWKAQHEKINQACKSLKAGAKIGLDAAPVVEAAVTKKRDALGWIARLAKLAADAVAALAEAGLKIPGGSL